MGKLQRLEQLGITISGPRVARMKARSHHKFKRLDQWVVYCSVPGKLDLDIKFQGTKRQCETWAHGKSTVVSIERLGSP